MNRRRTACNHALPQAGFTLIEGIIATAIIGSALIVGLSLSYSNLVATQDNSHRIIASQLAREGLEIIRNVRDSNWLRREKNIDRDFMTPQVELQTWDDFYMFWPLYSDQFLTDDCPNNDCYGNYFDIVDNSDEYYGPAKNLLYKPASTDPAKLSPLYCLTDDGDGTCRVYQSAEGYYYQTYKTPTSGSNLTPFIRRIVLMPICWDPVARRDSVDFDADAPDMVCPIGQQRIGILANAHVAWRRGGKISEIVAKERLYNWRTY